MIRYRSIKRKILAPLLISVTVIFVLFQGINDVFQYTLYQDAKLAHVQTMARAISYNLEAPLIFEDSESAQEQLDTFSVDEAILSVLLYDPLDNVIASYNAQDVANQNYFDTITYNWELEGHLVDDGKIFVFVPIESGGELVGKLKLVADIDFNKAKIQHLIEASTLIVLLGFGILYYLYGRLSKLILNPVYQIKESMNALLSRTSDFEPIALEQHDELGDLINGFNTMLSRLRARDRQISASMDKLEQERNFANELIESIAQGLFVVDKKGFIQHHNQHAAEQIGQQSVLVGTNINSYFAPRDKTSILMAVLGREHLKNAHFSVLSHIGERRTISVSTVQTAQSDMVLFSIRDVTDELAKSYRQKLASAIFENSKEGILVLDTNGKVLMVNPAFEKVLGYKEQDLLNQRVDEAMICPDFESKNSLLREKVIEHGQWTVEWDETHADGSTIPVQVQASFIEVEDQYKNLEHDLVLICTDLRDQKEMERLEHVASHDPLTQLANRTKFLAQTQQLIDAGQQGKFGMLFLDLDGFKAVNDQHGHDAGDYVLQVVAQRLRNVVRENDLVGRLAGDEFVVLVRDGDLALCNQMAERALGSISQPIQYKEITLNTGVSIGVHMTEAKIKETEASAIVKRADKAMYRAKFLGKGQFAVDEA